jgi:hypothetical protein
VLKTALGKLSPEERRALVKHLIHRLTNAISPLDIRLQLQPAENLTRDPLLKDAVFAVESIRALSEELQVAGGMEPLAFPVRE